MIIICGLVGLLVLCGTGALLADKLRGDSGEWFIGAFIAGLLLVIALTLVGANRLEMRGKIAAFHEAERTLEAARKADISPMELAAIQRTVVENNQWLATSQYYAQNPWTSWFVPSAVLELKSIR